MRNEEWMCGAKIIGRRIFLSSGFAAIAINLEPGLNLIKHRRVYVLRLRR